MSTTSRHRRPSSVRRFLPVIGAALVGTAVGVGGTTLVNHTSPTQQATPQREAPAGAAPSTADPATTDPAPSNTASSVAAPPPAAETSRSFDKVAFAAPVTDAAGLSMMVLPPEKVKGGVRFTISLVNTSQGPITVNTGALGPHEPRFNDTSVPMSMTKINKKLVPGEGYTYQCVFKLPTMDVGQVEFSVGSMNVAGQAAGD